VAGGQPADGRYAAPPDRLIPATTTAALAQQAQVGYHIR